MALEAAKEIAKELGVDENKFLSLADQIIGFANHSSTQMKREAVHLAFLYGISRYGAFAWQASPQGRDGDSEQFIKDMLGRYEQMLREQLGDPNLRNRPKSP